jgi:hypothetical protein
VMSESEEVVGRIPWGIEVWGAMSWSSCCGRVRVRLRMKQIGKGKETDGSNGWLLCLQRASGGVGGVFILSLRDGGRQQMGLGVGIGAWGGIISGATVVLMFATPSGVFVGVGGARRWSHGLSGRRLNCGNWEGFVLFTVQLQPFLELQRRWLVGRSGTLGSFRAGCERVWMLRWGTQAPAEGGVGLRGVNGGALDAASSK